ncbi:hypothetical protein [Methylobacterium sp. B1]|uniref:hypothetical protein n=1 Tax=Methylobacterium sp. B1 TaxID=91459 RepID=UPI0011D1CAED|nr:hypothetical protein [Methylobacterium sp. B1]
MKPETAEVSEAAVRRAVEIAQLPELDRTDAIYARAFELAQGPSRRPPRGQFVLNILYYGLLLTAFAWVSSMTIDRELPVHQISREIVNPNRQVRVGERLAIKGVRDRVRQCELTRRYWLVDGSGRRIDFEPEHFDAYGALGRETEIVGPMIPLDATPGRGRVFVALAYDCNALQRALGWSITTVLPPLEFEILPRAVP